MVSFAVVQTTRPLMRVLGVWYHHTILYNASGNGGGSFILRAILADVYEYDQLLTGERREAEFGVYIDFFGEKLPSIPGRL